MGPSTQLAVLGAVVVVVVVLVVATAVRSTRAGRRRQAALDHQLAHSRAEVELLGQRLAELTEEVAGARRVEAEHREYVITTLGGDPAERRGESALPSTQAAAPAPGSRPLVTRVLEDQLVGVLARQQGASSLRGRAVDVVVRTVALGHGVRRALSPDNLDRAAAEAHVARRRSRRTRRREVREARRFLRAARSSPGCAEEDAA